VRKGSVAKFDGGIIPKRKGDNDCTENTKKPRFTHFQRCQNLTLEVKK